jgi:hypothetical protein
MMLVCSCVCRYYRILAFDQPIWPTNHLPQRSIRHLCLAHARRLYQSRSRRQLQRFMGDWCILARLYLHLRLDCRTPDL